ncbi:3-carboxy-cis,cis-muconate cycloisomerase [Pseudomonas amygdali pv. mori]|uniref:3-carboxy-cis,cis-muconate cycloisomerase n=1 Tax=Pseudomonas amygdali pv. mori TaxID=34065 RepID=A0A0P9VXJ0_PSEA0|nr:3-carboxy-cis,cis-muconate cycloisomerase [Pseudomonas amygdali pv. mori]
MNRVSNQLFDAYFMQPEMREIFSDEGRVQSMLDFEAALARAQARVGLIPPEVVMVADIELSCDARLFDFDALAIAIGWAMARPTCRCVWRRWPRRAMWQRVRRGCKARPTVELLRGFESLAASLCLRSASYFAHYPWS